MFVVFLAFLFFSSLIVLVVSQLSSFDRVSIGFSSNISWHMLHNVIVTKILCHMLVFGCFCAFISCFSWHVLRRPFILPRLFLDSIQNDSTSWLFVACCLLCGVLLVLALGLFVLILVVVPVGAFFLVVRVFS